MTIILIGAVIAIIGGIVGAIGTFMHNKNSSEKSTRIEKGVGKNLEIGNSTNQTVINLKVQNENLLQKVNLQAETIDNAKTEIIDLQNKLDKKNDKIVELQNETILQTTGGKGVPQLLFFASKGLIMVALVNESPLPIKNVLIDFDIMVAGDKLPENRGLEVLDNQIFDNLINSDIGVGFRKNIKNIHFSEKFKQVTFRYTVNWRNGKYQGFFILENNNKELSASNEYSIYNYTKGYSYDRAVYLNGRFLKYNPEPTGD